ncbi:TraB/GumN family protein [Oceanisphaera avium]|uniref:TraB/GumN family protein n=1 Tax=Oceanisphaera avium TaxID=1903694 RepID=A0A1Y0CU36_9GAMM|nr:TraB/GumN family protein [Oceanisphaera avium]ART78863.1 hypothetical protein CBP12_00765 [Oceanisphaera avium]
MKIVSFLLLWLCTGYSVAAPALWSATKGSQQLWLFGSIHLADERLATLPKELLASLQHSQHLYLEVDPRDITPQVLAPFMTLDSANGSPLQHWDSRLGKALSQQLRQDIIEQNLTPLTQLPPWLAVMQLSQAHAQRLGFSSEQGVDLQLLRAAEQQQLTISSLEPPTLVFELMANLVEQNLEADFVRHSLEEQAQLAEHLEALFSAWQRGDEAILFALLDDQGSPRLSDFIRQELLIARNHLWLSTLKQQAPKQALIVVGALHLYGEQGLIKLLNKDGYDLHKVLTPQ